MSTSFRKILGLTALLAIAAVATPAVASHFSPASLGKYVDPGDELCFREDWGAMRNACTSERRFGIPVHTFWTGSQRAAVNVTAPDPSHPVCCQLITAENGGPYSIGLQVCTSTYRAASTLDVSAIFPPNGSGWVLCTVHPGAQVNHIWFSGS
jgi:hypothetical protein